MGWMDSIKEFFYKEEPSTISPISLDKGILSNDDILKYPKVEEIIKYLNGYQSKIKKMPRSLSELVRVSNNFCNHVIKVLMEYRKIMVSYEDFTNCSDYKLKLLEILGRLEKECENKSVLRFKVEEYEDIFGDGDSNKRGENSHLIGDFAESLRDAALCTCSTIGGYVGDYGELTKYLGTNNLSSVRKFIARFKSNVKNPLAGAVSSARQGTKRLFSNMFLVEEVEPIEYFNFDNSKYLGRSTVHGVSNIMNSYKKILKDYPKELINYVNSCLDCIKKIDALLKSYLKFLEVFMSPKRTRVDEIKAKQGMENELDELSRLIEKSLKNECIFCLKEIGPEGRLLNALEFKYNEKRDQWFNSELQDIGGGFFENVCKRNGTKIVLKGWSLGHFLCKFKPVVEYTKAKLNDLINFESNKINYEELEIKEPKSDKKPESSRSKVKDIAEMVKKADALKKRIRALWTQVQELAESKKFKSSDNAKKYGKIFGKNGSYDRFLEEYDKLVMSSVKDKVDGSGKNVLDENNALNENNALKECSSHFSVMNKHAQEIEKTCKSWIDFYGKDASIGKKKKEAEQKRILDNIKLFKRRFSKVFNEASDLAKKTEKEFNSVMELKATGADADLLKTYKQTMNTEYLKLKESFTFSFPLLEGTLVIFDYNGFNEDNLYSWIKHVYYYIENILIYEARNFKGWLSKLKQNFEEFDAEYEEAIYLFGKKKDIDEMVKKADALKKRIEMLYTKVQELKMSVFFKYSDKTSDIGKSYNKLFDKGGCYDNFLKAHQSFLEASSKVKTNAGEALQECTKHFSEMSKNAREIEKTCKGWIDYCGKNAFTSKKETEAAQKRTLDEFKLFKRRFSKVFNEAKGLAKKSEKELNSVMNLEATGADDDLLASYKQTLMNEFSGLIERFTFSHGCVIFDYDGFKEENLYDCIKHVADIRHFSRELQKKLDKLKQNFERFNAECEEVIKLFGKKKDIDEMVKKADALKKRIEMLYVKAQDLAMSEHFKEASHKRALVTKRSYKDLFGKDGCRDNFLKAYKNFKAASSKINDDSGAVLKECSKHFSVMNKHAQEIEKTCKSWIDFYGKDASIGKKKKEAEQKRILDNIKLFKRRFSKVFNEAKGLAKKSEKEFNSIMKLKETGADADLLATYKQTLMNKYSGLTEDFTFSLPFLKGTLVIFDYNGFNEDNLYNCIKHVDNIETFLIDRASELQRRLGKLREISEKFDSECEEVIKLFGKKNKENLQELSKTFNGLVKTLEKAIKDYKSAEELNEKFEKEYKNKKISKGFENDEHVWNYNSLIAKFEGAWEYLSSDYKKFELDETGEVIKDNSVILENVRAISKDSAETTIENENKRKQCDKLTQNIQSRLIGMREVFGKIKDLAEVIDIMQENTEYVAPKLIKAREDYKDAIELNTKFVALSGAAKFGKAFARNGSVKWFEQYWSGIQKQIDKLKSVSDIDISGPVPSAEEVSSISADQKKAGEVTKVLEDITSYCKDMHGYFKEIEKLVKDLAREKLEISEVLKGAIENYKAIEAFHNEYSQLYGWAEGVFSKDTSVEEFRKRYEISKEKIGELIELAYLRKSNHDYEPDETGILNMLFDYTQNNFEKYNECKAISKEIESNLKEMQKLIEPIRELSEKLKKVSDRLDEKDEGSDWFQILVNEYDAYNRKTLTELVDNCKKCAKEDFGIGILVKTPLEKYMKGDKTGGAGRWEDLKKLYSDTIAEYDKSKKALEEAIKKLGHDVESIKKGWHKKFDEAGLEVMKGRVGKVEYTSSVDISKKLKDFVEKVKEEKKKFEESEEAKKQ